MQDLATVWKVRGTGYSQEYSSLDTAMFHALRVSEATQQPMDIFESNWMTGVAFKVRTVSPTDFTILRRKTSWQDAPKAPPVPPRPMTPFERAAHNMGLSVLFSESDAKTAYRQMAMKRHPDQGGSKVLFQQLQDDYNLIRRTKGWK